MKLYEFDQSDSPYYDPNEDKINVRKVSDVRKPVLTLKQLNKLRRMRAYEKLETLKRNDLLGIIYGIPDESAGMGGMGGPGGF